MRRQTSRILNDQSFLMGLSYNDITLLGILLLGLLLLGKSLGLQNMILPLLFVAFLTTLLIPIRMKYRRKIVRDSLLRALTPEVIRVSRNSRIQSKSIHTFKRNTAQSL